MYYMKTIISPEPVVLSKCMYRLKNITSEENVNIEINIQDQESPHNHMVELEARQDKLLLKLDHLYEKIKNISIKCKINEGKIESKSAIKTVNKLQNIIPLSLDVVIILNSDNLPWFLNIFLKKNHDLNVTWHIHSSVSNEKIPKISAFFNKFQDIYQNKQDTRSNIRLIFKDLSSAPELKITTLDIPITGTVNILRYLCLNFKNLVPYNFEDYMVEHFLDLCHSLERSSDKNKEQIYNKMFFNKNLWIYDNQFTIIDLALYSITKQAQKSEKYVSKPWLTNCEKIIYT